MARILHKVIMNIGLIRNTTIDKVEIVSLFQPLYSVHEKKYIGVEALSRGLYMDNYLSAFQLFSLPKNEKETLELNKKCIKASLISFKTQATFNQNTIFLNIDSSLMDNSESGSLDFIIKNADKIGIEPRQIVIELIESRVKKLDTLLNFVIKCREQGFLIALDDVGAGYSNFERIVKIKPDIIKIDRGLVSGVSEEFHKREICRSLIELSHNIGALSLAEGVETINDALECQELGADILQGFYFSKPQEKILPVDVSAGKISLLVSTWNFSAKQKNKNLKTNISRVKRQANAIFNALTNSKYEKWDKVLVNMVEKLSDIECAYILDYSGTQISLSAVDTSLNRKDHFLFTPATYGTDHSQKYYFMKRTEDQKWFISDPYISRATGNICRTVSMMFINEKYEKYFLCLDITN